MTTFVKRLSGPPAAAPAAGSASCAGSASSVPYGVSPAVTLGLFAAWALHDAEEVAFGPRWIRENVPVLRRRFPQLPESVWEFMGSFDDREFRAAVGVMAVIVAGAAVSGQRSGGRSAFFQSTLDGFGLHGLLHLAQAAAVRGYTPGSATSPVLVLPFTLWARGRLRRAGVLRPLSVRGAVAGAAAAGAATVVSHTVARILIGRGRRAKRGSVRG
ncbi:HXXEE domain-containing protein [Streptomyces gilvosporeus]|uniref:HXXEE domain-containing protein n=1 Tax=Streptomyces gilvosporeus TaxID=553510 RepID=A0A1V0U3J8_9ACTN|nr:HXXEE domain-containing protein [Streptomyces gilvosporeus]ARF59763.1 HXXEE domain-containing protein [Streptomyces gilvosporeus]